MSALSSPLASPTPRVTLVMTVRERHRLTVQSIENVLANTTMPFRLIFSHGELPPWLDRAITQLDAAGKVERRAFPGLHWPAHLRGAVLDEIDTGYVAFIDNDIEVSPGWIERLIACAEETGAGIVGPIYLWGDGVAPPKVHMAGGMLRETKVAGGKVLEELHRHMDADPDATREALRRGPCDFVEYHCMVMRTELARTPGVIDPAVVAAHDHIDTCLEAKRLGASTWLEPGADVTYLARASHVIEDLPLMRARWDSSAVEASIRAFCDKWGVLPDDRSFGGVRGYIHDLRWRYDPLREHASRAGLEAPMERAELCQGRTALLELAAAREYPAEDLAMLGRASHLAAMLMDGGYRPCGRPFVSHLFGTAGVLVRYDFSLENVCEALLHAAYTHRRLPGQAVQQLLAQIHPQLEARVREYAQRSTAKSVPDADPGQCSPRDAENAAIDAANEIDMRLAGEYAASGRPGEKDAAEIERLAGVLEIVGVPGMARTLRACVAERREVAPQLVTGINVSYRFGPGNSLVPMATPR